MTKQEKDILGNYTFWKEVIDNKSESELLTTPECSGCDCTSCGPSGCVACSG